MLAGEHRCHSDAPVGAPAGTEVRAADGDRVSAQVVGDDQAVVRGERHVELDGVDAHGQGAGDAGQRVLGPQGPRAPVSLYLGHYRR